MPKHTKLTMPLTMVETLEIIIEELEQISIDAEDCDVLGVTHKLSEALGPLRSAAEVARTADFG